MADFFISYTAADRAWAEWIAWELEEACYSTVLQAWDFKAGSNFIEQMQKATEESDRTIAVLSEAYLAAEFTKSEWQAAFRFDPTGSSAKLVPVRVSEFDIPGMLGNLLYIDLVGLNESAATAKLLGGVSKGRAKPTSPPAFPSKRLMSAKPCFPDDQTPPKISLGRLPATSATFFSRESELQTLDEAWFSPEIRIVQLVGLGGAGKSALVNAWLRRLDAEDYRGAKRVFGWSFYSQGATPDRQVSGEIFVDTALRWFGDPGQQSDSFWEKGERLADMVHAEPTILVIDGVEPLQYAPGEYTGRLRDPAVRAFLRALASRNRGLCIVTTRLELDDLKGFTEGPVRRIGLGALSNRAGEQVLRALGVHGRKDGFRRAVRAFEGHALALTLLGRYLAEVCGGDVERFEEVGELTAEPKDGGHARRVMESYAKWFVDKPELLSILHMLGLFDRPASLDALHAIRDGDPIEGLTDALAKVEEPEWAFAISHLREARLVSEADGRTPDVVDCHPLVREYFGWRLKRASPTAWRSGHERLYRYYADLGEYQPDTLSGLAPLFAAVSHACDAGRHQEAFDEMLKKRILRGERYYPIYTLGAFGAVLSCLASFFDPPWTKTVASLSAKDRALVFSLAGYWLRAVGRLADADKPLTLGRRAHEQQGDWANAALASRNLSGLRLVRGEIADAVLNAKEAVRFANRSKNVVERVVELAALGAALHHAGEAASALKAFEEAEVLQVAKFPTFRLLYGVFGFQYCEFLLDQMRVRDVLDRVKTVLNYRTDDPWNAPLHHLSCARANLQIDDLYEAESHVREAVSGLRQAGALEFVAQALLARADVRIRLGELDRAREDLNEVMAFASCGMEVVRCDAFFTFAKLSIKRGESAKAVYYVGQTEDLAERLGYRRLDRELEEVTGRTQGAARSRREVEHSSERE